MFARVFSHPFTAFALRDGRFLAVGSNDDMKAVTGKDTKVIDLKGQMVMPGLIDTPYGADIPTSRMILLSGDITDNLFVQRHLPYNPSTSS
jgi:hypothetical protein